MIQTLAYHPDVPIYNEDGTYHGVFSSNYGDLRNPVGIFERNTQRNRFFNWKEMLTYNMRYYRDFLPKSAAL